VVKYIYTLSCIPSYFKCTHYCLLLIRSLWSVLLFSVLRICASQFCDCIVSDSRFYIFLERAPTRTERGCAWPSAYAIRSAAKIYGPNVDLRSAREPSAYSAAIRFSCRKFSLLSTDAESLHRNSLRLYAVTFADFSHNSNSLLRHLGFSFLLRSFLQLNFSCVIRLLSFM